MAKKLTHDWSFDMGPYYRCSNCRAVLTESNEKTVCKGLKVRSINEHAANTQPILNRFPVELANAQ